MKSINHLIDVARIELNYACAETAQLEDDAVARSRILAHLYSLGRLLELIRAADVRPPRASKDSESVTERVLHELRG